MAGDSDGKSGADAAKDTKDAKEEKKDAVPEINFKEKYTELESNISELQTPIPTVDEANACLDRLAAGTLGSEEHVLYFVETGLPRITKEVLHHKYQDPAVCAVVVAFLKRVVDVCLDRIDSDSEEIIGTLARVLDAEENFYLQLQARAPAGGRSYAAAAGGGGAASATAAGATETGAEPPADDPPPPPADGDDGADGADGEEGEEGEDGEDGEAEAPRESFAHLPVNSKWGSDLLVEMIDYFGGAGGFDKVVARLSDADNRPSLAVMAALVDVVVEVYESDYLFEDKYAVYVAQMHPVVSAKLRDMDEAELRTAKKEDIVGLIQVLERMLESVASPAECGEVVEQLCLDIAVRCFRSPVLEKRLYGLSYMKDAIDMTNRRQWQKNGSGAGARRTTSNQGNSRNRGRNAVRNSARSRMAVAKWMTTDFLLGWFRENKILDELFGASKQVQLVRRSADLLRFYTKYGQLTMEDMAIIWDCAYNSHEIFAEAVFKVLGEMTFHLGLDHIGFLFEHLVAIPRRDLTLVQLRLMKNLIRDYKQTPYKIQLLEVLWEIVVDESRSGAPIEICQEALAFLSEVLKSYQLHVHRRPFLEKIVVAMGENKSVPFGLKLAQNIINTFTQSKARHIKETRESVVAWMEEELDFLPAFFANVAAFKADVAAARAALTEEQLAANLNTTILSGRCEYLHEVLQRLTFLKIFLSYTPTTLGADHIRSLCEHFITDALTDGERDTFYRWLTEARTQDAESGGVLDDEVSAVVFEHLLEGNPATLSLDGFRCFQRFFVYSNVVAGSLIWTPGDDAPEFDFQVASCDFVGADFLWRTYTNAASGDVSGAASDLLTKVYANLVPQHMTDPMMAMSIRTVFLDQAMAMMESAANEGEAVQSEAIERAIGLIRAYLSKVEKNFSFTPHGASARGRPLKLELTNTIQDAQPPETFVLDVHSYATIGEIRSMVKAKLHLFQGAEADLVLKSQGADLADLGASLHDLMFDDMQQLIVTTTNEAALGEQGTTLRSRIAHSHAPVDDKPKPAQRPQSKPKPPNDAEELAIQLEEICSVSKKLAMAALEKQRWDLTNACLMLSDELERAQLVSQLEAEGALGGGGGNESEGDDGGAGGPPGNELSEDMQMVFPSVLLTSNAKYMDTLFGLLEKVPQAVQSKIWELLMSMPSMESVVNEIHTLEFLDGDAAGDWSSVLSTASPFRLLYSLQIIDALLFPKDDSSNVKPRAQWAHKFLSNAGFDHVYTLFVSTSEASGTGEAVGSYRKSCLALLLKIIDIFLRGALRRRANVPEPPSPSAAASGATGSGDDFSAASGSAGGADTEAVSEFGLLIAELSGQFSDDLLENIDNEAFCRGLIDLVIATAAAPAKGDGDVVAYAMRLLVLCVLAERSLVGVLYSHRDSRELLSTALFSPEPTVRAEAMSGFFRIATDVDSVDGVEPKVDLPRVVYLNTLLGLMHDNSTDVNANADQFYTLLAKLIDEDYVNNNNSSDGTVSRADILFNVVDKIKARDIVEKRDGSASDEVLVGMMRLALTILRREPRYNAEVGGADGHGLVHELYHNCLFAMTTPGDKARGLLPPKCKTTRSRRVAFELLAQLGVDAPSNALELMRLLKPHHTGAMRVDSWEYHPGSEGRNMTGYVGLQNLGSTCYINSLMQEFFMMPELRYGLLSAEDAVAEKQDSILYQIQTIFGYLLESEKMSYSPEGFCHAYKDWDGNPVNVRRQQDVDEFFNLLCQRLEEALKGGPHANLLSSLFGGKISNEIRSLSPELPYYSEREEDFFTISLDIKGKRTIEEALDAYVRPDILDGDNAYSCEMYGRKIPAAKGACIKSMSNTLIIHLKRFEFDFTAMRKVKVNDYCEFPTELNLEPWTREGQARLKREAAANAAAAGEENADGGEGGAGAAGDPDMPPDDIVDGDADGDDAPAAAEGVEVEEPVVEHRPDAYYQYQLVGALVHTGSADAGHYYSYIKEREPTGEDGEARWFEFNDKTVLPFSEDDLETECFGGKQVVTHWDNWLNRQVKRTYPRVRNAYMLFYERIEPLEEVEVEAEESSSSAADPAVADDSNNSGGSGGGGDTGAFQKSYLRKLERLATAREREGARAGREVPPEIYRAAWEENMKFLRDRQFFDENYFEFMLKASQLVEWEPVMEYREMETATAGKSSAGAEGSETEGGASAPPPPPPPLADDVGFDNIVLGTLFVIEVVIHSAKRDVLKDWVDHLGACYARHIPACQWFMNLITQDSDMIKELFLICPNEDVRIYLAQLLNAVMVALAPFERYLYTEREPLPDEEAAEMAKAAAAEAAQAYYGGGTTVGFSDPMAAAMVIIEPFSDDDSGEGAVFMSAAGAGSEEGSASNGAAATASAIASTRPKALLLRLIDRFFALFEHSRGFWRRFKQWWLIPRNFALLGMPERRYLVEEKRFFELYVDYFMGAPRPGQHSRVQIMDKYDLPDLTFFLDAVQVVVRGTTPECPEAPLSDLALVDPDHGGQFPIPESAAKEMFRTDWIQSMMQMDYNREAARLVGLYCSWESPERSQIIIEYMCDAIKSTSLPRLEPLLSILDSMLALEDSVQDLRIQMALSSAPPTGKPGLLGIIASSKIRSSRINYVVIKFILAQANTNPRCHAFLFEQKRDFLWIEKFLEKKLVDDGDDPAAAAAAGGSSGGSQGASSAAAGAAGPSDAADGDGGDDGPDAGAANAHPAPERMSSTFEAYTQLQSMLDDMPDPPPEPEAADTPADTPADAGTGAGGGAVLGAEAEAALLAADAAQEVAAEASRRVTIADEIQVVPHPTHSDGDSGDEGGSHDVGVGPD